MQKTKMQFGRMSPLSSCGTGMVVGLIVMILMISIASICILNEYFTLQNLNVVAAVIQFLTVLLGCTTAGKITDDNQILCCTATAGILLFVFIGAAMLFFDGVSLRILTGVIAAILALTVSLFFVLRKKKRPTRKKIKKPSR